ncbi:GNAT family N-acetyltransferase [Massilia horti]|uniref:N-acetyltransferase n=1 Tax=Massilia horti TaxID=2562153 RepID=A0A4Y9T5B0_9BURK|nr:GNAT family N-acetyltransferase [Massilia horti]TFW32327.1 N-acetyltransferase [Massilia horti]
MSGLTPIFFETSRLRIRFLTPDDVSAQFALYSDPDAMRYWSSEPWVDLSQAHQQIERDLRDYAEGVSARLAVQLLESGEVIGNVSLYAISDQNRRCEIGYMLSKSYQGYGYMTEALRAVIGYAFSSLSLNRIEADTDPRNERSCRLLERLGFQREGFMPERWVVAGEVCDTAFYGLLKRNYRN